jgi:hypothetical protein
MDTFLRSFLRRAALFSAAAAFFAQSACHESARDRALSPVSGADRTVAALVVEGASSEGSTALVHLRLVAGSDVGVLGSVTAAVDYDTLALRFVGESSVEGGGLRAVHADRGRVRVAVASAVGLDPVVVGLRFRVQDASALARLTLEVSELHRVDATDARASLVIAPVAGVR